MKSRLMLVLTFMLCLGACRVEVGPGDRAWNEWVAPYRHDLDVGGYRLHYIDIGQGEPILLIHGFADSTYTFHENVKPLLAAGYRVVLVDQPGLGRSDAPPDYFVHSIENIAGEIIKVADRLELNRFIVGGSSMGGGLALFIATNHPDRVTSVMAFDPVTYNLDRVGWMPLAKRTGLGEFGTRFASRFFVRFALEDVVFDDRQVDDILIDEYARPLNKPGFLIALLKLANQYFSPEFDSMVRRYPSLDKPVLAVWGEQDRWVPADFGRRLVQEAPRVRLRLIPECGHLSQLERPELVNPEILRFLAGARR